MRQPQHVFAMLEDSLVSARRRRVRAISDSVRVWWLSFLHRSGDPRVDFFVVLCESVSRGGAAGHREQCFRTATYRVTVKVDCFDHYKIFNIARRNLITIRV